MFSELPVFIMHVVIRSKVCKKLLRLTAEPRMCQPHFRSTKYFIYKGRVRGDFLSNCPEFVSPEVVESCHKQKSSCLNIAQYHGINRSAIEV